MLATVERVGLAAQEVGVPRMLISTTSYLPLFGVTKEASASTAAENRAGYAISAEIELALKRTVGSGRINFIDGWDQLCSGQRCDVIVEGLPVYFHSNQLTNRCAHLLVDLMLPALKRSGT